MSNVDINAKSLNYMEAPSSHANIYIYVYILHINIHEIHMLNKVKRQTIILKHNMSTKLKISNLKAMRH